MHMHFDRRAGPWLSLSMSDSCKEETDSTGGGGPGKHLVDKLLNIDFAVPVVQWVHRARVQASHDAQ